MGIVIVKSYSVEPPLKTVIQLGDFIGRIDRLERKSTTNECQYSEDNRFNIYIHIFKQSIMICQQIKKAVIGILVVFAIFSNSSCVQNNKSQSPESIEVNNKFQKIKELAKHRNAELFTVFNSSLTDEETQSLKFLYANMPLSDLADYSGNYYLGHVKTTLESRDEFAWGKTIPKNIFNNFVLFKGILVQNPAVKMKR